MSVLIALPCYGGILSSQTARGLFNLGKYFENARISHDILFVTNQSLIHKARNDIANFFLNATNFKSLLWIDADLGFEYTDVLKLIEMDEPHVTGTYRHKTPEIRYSFTLDAPDNKIQWHPDYPACKILRNCGGFSLIKREVFDTIVQKGLVSRYNPASHSRQVSEKEMNNSWFFYETPLDDNYELIPEDFAFQDKCIAAGFDIWLRPDIQLIHNGNANFSDPSLLETLRGF